MNEPSVGSRPSASPLPRPSEALYPLTDHRLSLLQQQTGASRREILLFFRQYQSSAPPLALAVTNHA